MEKHDQIQDYLARIFAHRLPWLQHHIQKNLALFILDLRPWRTRWKRCRWGWWKIFVFLVSFVIEFSTFYEINCSVNKQPRTLSLCRFKFVAYLFNANCAFLVRAFLFIEDRGYTNVTESVCERKIDGSFTWMASFPWSLNIQLDLIK